MARKIGYTDPDGQRHLPDVAIDGSSFVWPATTHDIGSGEFVVVPVGLKPAALKDLIAAAREEQRQAAAEAQQAPEQETETVKPIPGPKRPRGAPGTETPEDDE